MEAYLQYRRIGRAVHRQLEDYDGAHEKNDTNPETGAEGVLRDDGDPVAPVRTHQSRHTAIGHALTGIHVREDAQTGKLFIVDWDGQHDPLNPRNYSTPRRIAITLMVSAIAFAVGAASSIDSAIIPQAAADFGVSEVAESLCVGE